MFGNGNKKPDHNKVGDIYLMNTGQGWTDEQRMQAVRVMTAAKNEWCGLNGKHCETLRVYVEASLAYLGEGREGWAYALHVDGFQNLSREEAASAEKRLSETWNARWQRPISMWGVKP